jgi:diguanylate cyclase (GGDEF)-like protein
MNPEHVREAETRRSSTRQRTWALCAAGIVAIGLSTAAVVLPLVSAQHEVREVHRLDTALQRASDQRIALADFQVYAEPNFGSRATQAPDVLAQGAILAQRQFDTAAALIKSLSAAGLDDVGRELKTANAAYAAQLEALSPVAAGGASPEIDALIAGQRAAFMQMWTVIDTTSTTLRLARDAASQQSSANLDRARTTAVIVGAVTAAVALLAALAFGHLAHRRERVARTHTRRIDFEASLQEALEMSKDESAVYGIMAKGLRESLPHLQSQTLIADSSRAHFLETVNTGTGRPGERGGCSVVSPLDCPATVRGQTLVFPTSTALNACPYLQDRPSGDCSAACIPISIAGKTVGVTHATGADQHPPDETDVHYLEITSRRASERLAMLRAFEKSETQAHSDPLTGLWNRRSLENRVRDLQREGIHYALAYGDLDHFKNLNDTHGHEAGDQALRMFSRVLRDSIRPNDIAARYGGEEFVVVLPDSDLEAAALVLDRVRERLALALTAGRVPAFTVSFGVASSGDADSFEDVVAAADRALLGAKAAGRDRVITAAEPVMSVEDFPDLLQRH